MRAALQSAGEIEQQLLDKSKKRLMERLGTCKFPPRAYLSLRSKWMGND
ncbi:hypothetical protein ID866_12441 [Astraeus odoratus]|nr:hypothetical protein ID866_12441 [Astraeus odoratus]